jgi:hypothetical protein
MVIKAMEKIDTYPVPDLDVYIIDIKTTKEDNVPMDYDGAKDRKENIILNDKIDSDKKNTNIVSD